MALVRELLLDYPYSSANRLTLEERYDIQTAIELAVRYKLLTAQTLYYLDLYVAGYSIEEIAENEGINQDILQEELTHACSIIEELSGYTDDRILKLAELNYSAARVKAAHVEDRLKELSKDFTYAQD